jgi:hypothetical protein
MQQRLCCPWLAATVLATALGGVATPASAAIRVVISDGSTTQVFYSSGDGALFGTATLGTFDVVFGAAVTNFNMQSASGASLNQIVAINDFAGGALPTLTITSSVIDAIMGISDGLITGGNEGLVLAALPARFLLPSSTNLLVTSDVDANANSGMGTVQNITSVNNIPIPSLAIPIDGVNPPEAQQQGNVGNNPVQGFTLVSEIVIAGASPGLMGSIGATSTVNGAGTFAVLIPEPGQYLLWGLGALGIVVTAAGGRHRRLALS